MSIFRKQIVHFVKGYSKRANQAEQVNLLEVVCQSLGIESISKEIAPHLFINISTNDNWGLRKLYLHFKSNSKYCSSIYNSGWLHTQLKQIQFIKDVVAHIPKPIIFWDLGANYGLYSLLLSKHVDQVIAIEPSSETCQLFDKSCRMSNIDNIFIFKGAVSSEDKDGFLYLSSIQSGDHRTYKPSNEEREREKIIMRKLDTIAIEQFKTFPKNNFIKLDVQGSEVDVLKGSKQLIQNSNTFYLFMEYGFTEMKDNKINPKELLLLLEDLELAFCYEDKQINPLAMEHILEEEFLKDNVVKDYLLVKKH